MKVTTKVKAGRLALNHNESAARGMRVSTKVKAGRLAGNHNESVA